MDVLSKRDEFAIRIFACLLIVAGADSLCGMAYALFNGSIHIDFSFLGLLIGMGLLERKEVWRKWAVFVAWLGMIASPVTAALLAHVAPDHSIEFCGIETGIVLPLYWILILSGAWFAFSFWQRSVLEKQDVKAQFTPTGQGSHPWATVITVMALLFSVLHYSHTHLCRTLVQSIQHYDTTLQVVDANTGEPINPTLSGPIMPSDKILPKLFFGTATSENGTSLTTVQSLACKPVTIQVSSKGYKEKDVPLGQYGRTIRVELEPIESY